MITGWGLPPNSVAIDSLRNKLDLLTFPAADDRLEQVLLDFRFENLHVQIDILRDCAAQFDSLLAAQVIS